MSELLDLLQKIGMDQTELKVYETIVAFGFHTAGQVTQKTGLGYPEVKKAAENLIQKNYLKKKELSSIEGSIYFPLAPKIAISSNLSESLSERLKSLSTKISKLWDATQSKIDVNTGTLVEQIHQSFTDYANRVDQLGNSSASSLDEWRSHSLQKFTNMTDDAISEFKKTVIDPLSKLSGSLTKISETIKNQSQESIVEINEKTESHKQSIEGAVTAIKQELEEFADEVGFIFSGRVSGLNQILENLAASTSESGDGLISGFEKEYKEALTNDMQLYNSLDENLVQITTNEYQSVTEKVQKANSSYGSAFSTTIDAIESKINSIKGITVESSNKVIDEFANSQKNSIINLKDQFLKALSSVQNNAIQQLDTILNETTSTLKTVQSDVEQNLNTFQGNLGSSLKDLSHNVGTSLETRFNEIEALLGQFVSNLQSSVKTNVGDTTQSIISTKEFLQSFLITVQDTFNSQIEELQQDIKTELSQIVGDSTKAIDNSTNQNSENLAKIEDDVNSHLQEFQSSLESFLQTSKTDLQNRIESTQNAFSEKVKTSITNFQSDSEQLQKDQEKQIQLLSDEIDDLTISSDRAQESLLEYINNELDEIKSTQLDNLSSKIEVTTDSTSASISNFNKSLQSKLKEFYSKFDDETRSLRDDVPQTIENLFVDQIDRLEGFRRKFDGNRGKIIDFFAEITQKMNPGEKVWKDKNFQSEFYENAARYKSDFQKFVSDIQNHFKLATEDAEDSKQEVLAEFNKAIQDEITRLEDIILEQEKSLKKVGEEFTTSFTKEKENIHKDLTESLANIFENIRQTVTEDLKTKFEEPIKSILEKSKAIGTGSDENSEDNPILTSQTKLLEQLNSNISAFQEDLEKSFGESVASLEAKVNESISSSNSIIEGLKQNLAETFSKQKDTSGNISVELKNQIQNTENKLNTTLSDTLNTAKDHLKGTFESKSTEVHEAVTKKTDDITNATVTKLDEIQSNLETFKSNMQEIQSTTTETVGTTVNNAIDHQQSFVNDTLGSLNESTTSALGKISTTQSSLQESVGKPLENVGNDIQSMVSTYDDTTSKAKMDLERKINEFYDLQDKLSELLNLKGEMNSTVDLYINQVTDAQDGIISSLKTELESLKNQKIANQEDFTTKMSTLLSSISSTNTDFVLDLFDQVSTQLSSVQAEVLGAIENTKSNIDITVTNAVETVRTDILQPSNEVVNAINESSSLLTNKLGEIAGNLTQIQESEDSTIDNANNQLNETIKNSVNSEIDMIKSNTENLFRDHSSKLSNMSGDFEVQVNSATHMGKEAVTGELSQIPTIIEDTLDAAAQSMALLNELSKGAIELDPTTPDTSYFEASPEAIKTNLNGLLERTKSSVTIVAPTISWLNPDLIPEFKRATVRIVIDPDQLTETDKDLIKKFQENNVNVALRQVDKNRYRRELNMIVASRDKEEIMLSKLLTTDEPYAFISQDEYFIELFTEVIAPFGTMPEYKQ